MADAKSAVNTADVESAVNATDVSSPVESVNWATDAGNAIAAPFYNINNTLVQAMAIVFWGTTAGLLFLAGLLIIMSPSLWSATKTVVGLGKKAGAVAA